MCAYIVLAPIQASLSLDKGEQTASCVTVASDFPVSNDEFHKTQKLEQSSKTPWRHLVSAARRVRGLKKHSST